MENLEVALSLAALGLYVFPCRGEGAEDDLKKPCPGIGWRGVSTTDPRTIKMFWHRFPTAVPGVDMGKSGLLAVDCDCKHSDGLAWIGALGIDVEAAPGSITPSGGRHLIYRNPDEFTNGRGSLPPKDVADLDIRGKGGYIIGPGSRFADGREYLPVGSLAELEELPQVLAECLAASPPVSVSVNGHQFTVHPEPVSDHRLRQWASAALDRILGEIAAMPPGNRNDPIAAQAWKAGQLAGSGGLSEGEVIQAIEGVVSGWPDLKKGYLGDRGTVRRQVREGMGTPRYPKDETPAVVINLNGTRHDPETGEVREFATPYTWTEPATIPRRDWLYGTLLVRKFVSMTVAPGGVGKSSMLTVEALAQVSGRDLLGVHPPRRLNVWLWNLEDPYEEITRKIQATAKYYGLVPDDLTGRLFVNSGRDRALVVAETFSGHTVLKPIVEELILEIRRLAIDVLIIDPFVSCNNVSENDNSGQDMVVKAWAKVAEQGGCAVHLVDHARKGQPGVEVTAGSNRGASAKVDGSRVVRVINPMTDKQAKEIGLKDFRRYFRTINDKANLAPPAERSDWFKLESVNLGNGVKMTVGGVDMTDGDSVGVVIPWQWPALKDAVEGVDLDVVSAALAGGKWRESSQAKDWIGTPIAAALGVDIDTVKRMIKSWIRDGWLEEYTDLDSKRNERIYLRPKSAPPLP